MQRKISYLLFPGQGSQKIGMGKDLVDNFVYAKEIFAKVDEALEQKLSDIIWGEDQELLNLTQNTQPALMAVCIALTEVLKQETDIFSSGNLRLLAGHSLGEYSAYVASEAIDVASCAKLLRIRGKAMQQAVKPQEGAMVAVLGLEVAKIAQICQEVSSLTKNIVSIANFNSLSQIVISGEKKSVDLAMTACQEAKAKRCVVLRVSAPFHCSLMQPAQDVMYDALEKSEIQIAKYPIISNVTTLPTSLPKEIKETLTQQVTAQVKWHDIMEYIKQDNNDNMSLLEIGPGRVLCSLAKKAGLECLAVFNSEHIKQINNFIM